jgi:hypothetical protein
MPGPWLVRYAGPLTEELLLEIIGEWRTFPGAKMRHVTVSTQAAVEWVERLRDRISREYKVEAAARAPTVAFEEDSLRVLAPGVELKLEVTFALPPGFLTVD